MSHESSNSSRMCPYGAFIVLLLLPFLSIIESHHHHHSEKLFLFNSSNQTKNDSVNSIDSGPDMIWNDTLNFNETTKTLQLFDSNTNLSGNGNYTAFNKSCYQCLFERQLESAIFKIMHNATVKLPTKPNESCARCLALGIGQFSNRTKSVGCMCGLYTTQSPGVNDLPLRTKVFHNVSCHELIPFEDACKKVCILGTLSYNELEPETLCYHLTSGTNIRAYVESKICRDDTHWVFTGLASSTPICCEQGTPVSCPQ